MWYEDWNLTGIEHSGYRPLSIYIYHVLVSSFGFDQTAFNRVLALMVFLKLNALYWLAGVLGFTGVVRLMLPVAVGLYGDTLRNSTWATEIPASVCFLLIVIGSALYMQWIRDRYSHRLYWSFGVAVLAMFIKEYGLIFLFAATIIYVFLQYTIRWKALRTIRKDPHVVIPLVVVACFFLMRTIAIGSFVGLLRGTSPVDFAERGGIDVAGTWAPIVYVRASVAMALSSFAGVVAAFSQSETLRTVLRIALNYVFIVGATSYAMLIGRTEAWLRAIGLALMLAALVANPLTVPALPGHDGSLEPSTIVQLTLLALGAGGFGAALFSFPQQVTGRIRAAVTGVERGVWLAIFGFCAFAFVPSLLQNDGRQRWYFVACAFFAMFYLMQLGSRIVLETRHPGLQRWLPWAGQVAVLAALLWSNYGEIERQLQRRPETYRIVYGDMAEDVRFKRIFQQYGLEEQRAYLQRQVALLERH